MFVNNPVKERIEFRRAQPLDGLRYDGQGLSLVVFVGVGVLVGEGVERFLISLLGCLLVPLHGFGFVRGEYALDAELVHKAKMELGDCIALVRFLLVRLHGFNVVLGVGEGDEGGKQLAHVGASLARGGAAIPK